MLRCPLLLPVLLRLLRLLRLLLLQLRLLAVRWLALHHPTRYRLRLQLPLMWLKWQRRGRWHHGRPRGLLVAPRYHRVEIEGEQGVVVQRAIVQPLAGGSGRGSGGQDWRG